MLADKVIVFANLKPKKMAGVFSEGMVMCASSSDHTAVELMRPHNNSPIGERVMLEGHPGFSTDPQPVLNPKKKIEVQLLKNLMTDAECNGLYNGTKLVTKSGPIVSKTLSEARI